MAAHLAPSITQLVDQCFEELEAHAEDQGLQITVEQLARFGLLLGRNWPKALQVLDKAEVQCFQAQHSGRRVFQVPGSSNEQYLTMPRSFCSCQAHYYEVVSKSEAPYCKHQLAARLAFALKRCSVTVVPDTALAEHLLQA